MKEKNSTRRVEKLRNKAKTKERKRKEYYVTDVEHDQIKEFIIKLRK